MCDFHDFGLIFAGQMHCLTQRLKSKLFEIFLNRGCPKAEGYPEFQTMLILVFEVIVQPHGNIL